MFDVLRMLGNFTGGNQEKCIMICRAELNSTVIPGKRDFSRPLAITVAQGLLAAMSQQTGPRTKKFKIMKAISGFKDFKHTSRSLCTKVLLVCYRKIINIFVSILLHITYIFTIHILLVCKKCVKILQLLDRNTHRLK